MKNSLTLPYPQRDTEPFLDVIAAFSAVMMEAWFKIEEKHHLHFWPMRLCLAYVRWPKFLTAMGYWLGQGIMVFLDTKR
jgi:hypothetical protein